MMMNDSMNRHSRLGGCGNGCGNGYGMSRGIGQNIGRSMGRGMNSGSCGCQSDTRRGMTMNMDRGTYPLWNTTHISRGTLGNMGMSGRSTYDSDHTCGCRNAGYARRDNDNDHRSDDHDRRSGSCSICGRSGNGASDRSTEWGSHNNGRSGDSRNNGCGCNSDRMGINTRNDSGCGCSNGCDQDSSCEGDCSKLMDQIRAVDFALVELVLYLDAYPDSCEALATYRKLIDRRRELYEQYESTCGPITAMGNRSETSWDWIDKPFPWEYHAN